MYPIQRITLSLHLPGKSVVSLRGPRGVKRVADDYVAGHTGHHDIEFKVRGIIKGSLLLSIEVPSADPDSLSGYDQSLIRIESRELELTRRRRSDAGVRRGPRMVVG